MSTEYGPWNSDSQGSETDLNKMTIPNLTGVTIATLNPLFFTLVKCIETGGGFTVNHVYQARQDGTGWIDASAVDAHSHSSLTDGGLLVDLFRLANAKFQDLNLTKTVDLLKANWIQTVAGSGSIEDSTDGTTGERSIRLRTNATNPSKAQIQYPHLKLDFSKRSIFQFKARIETITSMAFMCGPNSDDVDAAPSNTVKYNAEICTTDSNKWALRSAHGTDKTKSDTAIDITTNRVGIRIEHLPDLSPAEVDMYVDNSSVFQKTSHVPVTGATADNNIVKASQKNSTGADRPIHFYGCRLRYYVSDNWV